MIYHAASVVRAVNRSLVVVDLPFGSYQWQLKNGIGICYQDHERIRRSRGKAGRRAGSERICYTNIVGRSAGNGPSWTDTAIDIQIWYCSTVRAKEEVEGEPFTGRCQDAG